MIRRELGTERTAAILVLLISELVRFFNVGKTMNDQQCAETVRLVLAEYYYLNLADFRLCFDRIKSGYYGRAYDRIDGQIILLALAEYVRGRSEVAATLSLQQHEQARDIGDQLFVVRIDDAYLEWMPDSDEYHEGPRHRATSFSYAEAHSILKLLATYAPTIEPATQPDQSLIDWMRIHAPSMLRITQRSDYLSRRAALVALKAEIDQGGVGGEEISERVRGIIEN